MNKWHLALPTPPVSWNGHSSLFSKTATVFTETSWCFTPQIPDFLLYILTSRVSLLSPPKEQVVPRLVWPHVLWMVIGAPQLSRSAESQLLPRSYNRSVLSSRANITVFCLRFLQGIQNKFLPLTKTGSSLVSTLGITGWLVSRQSSWSDAVALAVAFAVIVHTKSDLQRCSNLFSRLAFSSLHVEHNKT